MPKQTNRSQEQKIAEAEVQGFREDLGPFVVAAETTALPSERPHAMSALASSSARSRASSNVKLSAARATRGSRP
jgi:hypothetical protein